MKKYKNTQLILDKTNYDSKFIEQKILPIKNTKNTTSEIII